VGQFEVQAAMFRRLTRQSAGRATEVPAREDGGADVAASSHEAACQQLLDMGFQREPVVQALQATNGNVSDAILLLVNAEEPPGNGASAVESCAPAENMGMDALDAMLTETLRMSEEEAAAEQRQLESEEKARVDAALAASVEIMDLCASEAMCGSDAVAPPGLPQGQPQGPPQGQPHGKAGPAAPRTTRAESKADEPRRGLPVRTLDDAELCEKVLGASARRSHQQESPLHGRPGLQTVSQSEVLQGPDGPHNSFLETRKQLLPPLVTPQHEKIPGIESIEEEEKPRRKFPGIESIEEEEKPRRRQTPKGQKSSCKSDELPVLSPRTKEADSWPPKTADMASNQASEDVIKLSDIEHWRVNGATSSRPHTRDAAAKCAATSLPKSIPGTPQTLTTPQMSTKGTPHGIGSGTLRPSSTHRGGPRGGPSSSSAFRAAATLSL